MKPGNRLPQGSDGANSSCNTSLQADERMEHNLFHLKEVFLYIHSRKQKASIQRWGRGSLRHIL
jgi:hypothetical protein